jgi:hypothetical protein
MREVMPTDLADQPNGVLLRAGGPLVADIRGLTFALDGDGSCLDRFQVGEASNVDYRVEVSCGGLPRSAWRRSEVQSVSVERSLRIVHLTMTELAATFDLGNRVVRSHLEGPWPGALEVLLRNASQLFGLESRRTLFLHAACVERGGEAYVFMGRSGSGKTTVALLSQSAGMASVVREELTCLGDLADGAPLCAFALPFREKKRVSARLPAAIPLRGLYWLEQADVDAVVRVATPEQVRRIAMATSLGVRDKLFMIPALQLCEQLVRRIPLRVLRFRKSVDFWRAIDDDLARV